MSEVWLLWHEDNTPWEHEEDLIDIFTTEEIAQKHCDEENKKIYDYELNHWREVNKKRPDEFPDKDLEPIIEYYIQSWDVSTE